MALKKRNVAIAMLISCGDSQPGAFERPHDEIDLPQLIGRDTELESYDEPMLDEMIKKLRAECLRDYSNTAGSRACE